MDSLSHEHVCHCGHTFAQYGHLQCHQRSCRATHNILAGALAKGKELLMAKKRRRLGKAPGSIVTSAALSLPVVSEICC